MRDIVFSATISVVGEKNTCCEKEKKRKTLLITATQKASQWIEGHWYKYRQVVVEDPEVLIRAKESKETDIKVSTLDTPQSSKQQATSNNSSQLRTTRKKEKCM